MTLLDLPSRHHALHALGLLVQDDGKRFGELVKATGHHDAQIARALDFLEKHHYVRSRTLAKQGKRIILAYEATARGKAAWEAFEAYREAIRTRSRVFGKKEIQAVENVFHV